MINEYIIEIIKEVILLFAVFNIFKHIALKINEKDIYINQVTYTIIMLVFISTAGFMVYLFEFELLYATNPEIPVKYILPIRIIIVVLSFILIYSNYIFIKNYYRNQMKKELGKDFLDSYEIKYFKKERNKFLLKSGNNLIKNYLTEEIKRYNIKSFSELYVVLSEYDTCYIYDNLYGKEIGNLNNENYFVLFKVYNNEVVDFTSNEIKSIVNRFNN